MNFREELSQSKQPSREKKNYEPTDFFFINFFHSCRFLRWARYKPTMLKVIFFSSRWLLHICSVRRNTHYWLMSFSLCCAFAVAFLSPRRAPKKLSCRNSKKENSFAAIFDEPRWASFEVMMLLWYTIMGLVRLCSELLVPAARSLQINCSLIVYFLLSI